MKTLQNNFTTPEQSKRLLELGVPADSADCTEMLVENGYIVAAGNNHDWSKAMSDHPDINYMPCWSVGRLIEICLRCSTLEQRQVLFFCNGDDDYYDFMAYTINVLESGIMTNHMDFSKLEE